MIHAHIQSHDGLFDFTLDATAYFERLTPDELDHIRKEDFVSGDATAAVAGSAEHCHPDAQPMFDHLAAKQLADAFDVTVSAEDVLAWLRDSGRATQQPWLEVTRKIAGRIEGDDALLDA